MFGIALGGFVQILFAPRKGDYMRSVRRKATGEGAPNPSAGAGDQDNFSFEVHGFPPSRVYFDGGWTCTESRHAFVNGRSRTLRFRRGEQPQRRRSVGCSPSLSG